MFTGLVETTGTVGSVLNTGNGIRLSVKPASAFDLNIGDSISVNGVCLTVTKHDAEISFDVSPETLKSTNLGALRVNDRVNLERALRLSDRLGGHLVTGHVDGTGVIKDKRQTGEYTFYSFDAPAEVLKYMVKKGSVTVDGISLTVVDIDARSFRVAIIPHTLAATNLGEKGVGDRVNLEADIIGKYVERLLGKKGPDTGLMDLLKEEGFVSE
jgi:riboflavin synthase